MYYDSRFRVSGAAMNMASALLLPLHYFKKILCNLSLVFVHYKKGYIILKYITKNFIILIMF